MKLFYNCEVVGEIVTDRSMTVMEACELLNIDLYEMEDEYTHTWEYALFDMDYES